MHTYICKDIQQEQGGLPHRFLSIVQVAATSNRPASLVRAREFHVSFAQPVKRLIRWVAGIINHERSQTPHLSKDSDVMVRKVVMVPCVLDDAVSLVLNNQFLRNGPSRLLYRATCGSGMRMVSSGEISDYCWWYPLGEDYLCDAAVRLPHRSAGITVSRMVSSCSLLWAKMAEPNFSRHCGRKPASSS